MRISSKFSLYQHKETGAIKTSGDYRSIPDPKVWTEVIPGPTTILCLAQALCGLSHPADLETGDTVWLEDIIPDVIGGVWNQGSAWRLPSCMAVWTGEDFDLLYDENRDRQVAIG
ncbi:MAG: hypothetical protein IPJ06_00715 [Saprospiraceae bacterium]|nr:hypothetical protein [Saprospiraceae bacterium]